MNDEENPYSSPQSEDRESLPHSPTRQIVLGMFLGLQAGGFLGFFSGCLAPLRYFLGALPFERGMFDELSSSATVQILGESIFIAMSGVVFGATYGAVIEMGEKLMPGSRVGSNGFLLASLKIHSISARGLGFAIVSAPPALLILIAASGRRDGFLWLHGLWAVCHLVLSIYFGERFAEACQRMDSAPNAAGRSASP